MTKTTRRRLLILVSASVLVAGGVGAAVWHRARSADARLLASRAEGMDLFAKEKYADALGQLSRYIGKNQTDKDALFAYAKSRALTEEPDGRHLIEGSNLLRRYLDLAPDDIAARSLLLDLYIRAGYGNEALQLADRVLTESPDDRQALRARYISLARLRRLDESKAAVLAYLDRQPQDLAAHWDALDLISTGPSAAADAAAHADRFAKVLGDADPRSMLIRAAAALFTRDPQSALALVQKTEDAAFATASPAPSAPTAAPRVPAFTPDADFISRLSGLYDNLGRYSDSQRLIERAAESKTADPDLTYALAMRLWAAGHLDRVIARTETIAPDDRASPSRLLGLRALSLLQSQRRDDARPIVTALAARQDDAVAVAWSLALSAAFLQDDATPLSRQKDYRSALLRLGATRDRLGRAVMSHFLAGVYHDLGETELALVLWRQSIESLPQWQLPYRMASSALLRTGNLREARDIAAALVRRSATIDNIALLADAWGRDLAAAPDVEQGRRLLDLVDNARAQAPDDPRLLPATVLAQAVAGRRSKAIDTARAALALSPDKLSPDVSAQITEAAIVAGLGLTAEALPAPADLRGGPDTVLRHAIRQHAQGQGDSALAALTASAQPDAPLTPALVPHRLVLAHYLDETAAPDAIARFKSLAAEAPDRVDVQQAVLAARSTWADLELIGRSVDRLRALSGEDGITWRVGRARMLLESPALSDRDLAEAVSLLSGVVQVAPKLVMPRVLLARAFSGTSAASALDNLSVAAELDPQSPGIALALTKMLMQQGKLDDARTAVRRIARSPRLTPGERVGFAELLAELGDRREAIELLSRTIETPEATGAASTPDIATDRDAALARLLSADPARRPEAFKLYERLLAAPSVEPRIAIDAATLYAQTGDLARAREILNTSLAKATPDIADAARAGLEEQFGSPDRAIELTRAILARHATSPNASTDPAPHIALSGLLLRLGRYEDAATAIDAGLKAAPTSPQLATLSLARTALLALRSRPDLQLLIALVTRDPADPAARATLEALQQQNYRLAEPDTLSGLRRITETSPRFFPAHALLIEALLAGERRREAVEAAGRMIASLPGDVDAVRVAAAAHLAAREWQGLLGLASRWRALTPDNPVPADLALASAYLGVADPDSAVRQLAPHAQRDDVGDNVRPLLCRALFLAGREPAARELFTATWNARARSRHLLLAAITEPAPFATGLSPASSAPAAAALRLLDFCAATLAQSDTDRFLLARAYYQHATAYRDAAGFERSESLIAAMDVAPRSSPAVRLLQAEVFRSRGDLAAAERAYRALLDSAGNDSFLVLNNLADLLVRRALLGTPTSAASAPPAPPAPPAPSSTETTSTTASPSSPTTDIPAASKPLLTEAVALARRAVELQPGLAVPHETLARALAASGDTAAATDAYNRSLRLAPERIETLIGYASLVNATGDSRQTATLVARIDALLRSPDDVPQELRPTLDALRSASRRPSL